MKWWTDLKAHFDLERIALGMLATTTRCWMPTCSREIVRHPSGTARTYFLRGKDPACGDLGLAHACAIHAPYVDDAGWWDAAPVSPEHFEAARRRFGAIPGRSLLVGLPSRESWLQEYSRMLEEDRRFRAVFDALYLGTPTLPDPDVPHYVARDGSTAPVTPPTHL